MIGQKILLGQGCLRGENGNWRDVDNDQVVWKDISFDYDFSQGMPGKIEVKFLKDARGQGSNEDRNLIVDKIKVDGLSIESEGDFSKYPQSDGKAGFDGRVWNVCFGRVT